MCLKVPSDRYTSSAVAVGIRRNIYKKGTSLREKKPWLASGWSGTAGIALAITSDPVMTTNNVIITKTGTTPQPFAVGASVTKPAISRKKKGTRKIVTLQYVVC